MNILEFQIYNFDEHLCVEQGRLRNMANTITNNKLLMAGEKIEDSPVKILGTILKYIFLNMSANDVLHFLTQFRFYHNLKAIFVIDN